MCFWLEKLDTFQGIDFCHLGLGRPAGSWKTVDVLWCPRIVIRQLIFQLINNVGLQHHFLTPYCMSTVIWKISCRMTLLAVTKKSSVQKAYSIDCSLLHFQYFGHYCVGNVLTTKVVLNAPFEIMLHRIDHIIQQRKMQEIWNPCHRQNYLISKEF